MKEITAQEIIQGIIESEGLDTKNRKRELTYRRQYLMWFLRQVTNMSTIQIGKMFNRDHATVLHSCRNVDYCVTMKDEYFLSFVADLKNQLDEYDFSKPKYKGDSKRVLTLFINKDDYKNILNNADINGKSVSKYVMSCVRGWSSITK